jgi:glycosyltransferase involved in cell wall biosynthesis
MIRLSIVVAVYNTENYLGRCLNSLINQDIPSSEYEILVINDGSPDNSAEIIEKYRSEFPQIVCFDQENHGLFETRNKGIELARGTYIYFVDSDDFIAENVLGKILSCMEEENLDVFGFGIQKTSASTIPSPNLKDNCLKDVRVYDGPTFIANSSYPKESVWLVINRSFLIDNSISYHKGKGFSDGLFTTQSLYYASRIVTIPDKIYAYYQHADSILNRASPKHYRELIKRYEATALDFAGFYKTAEAEARLVPSGLQRIKSMEVSYVFFMLVRLVKSDLSLSEIKDILSRLVRKGYYPIKGFIGEDYSGFIYRTLVFIFNHKILFYPSVVGYRLFSRLKRVLR